MLEVIITMTRGVCRMKRVRHYTVEDKCIMAIDRGLRTLFSRQSISQRENPAANIQDETDFTLQDQKKSAALMRVNHAGEVCAQALYQGQALTSRNTEVKAKLAQAANEEQDHLAWCEQRLQELNSHTSYLGPVWYGGSFLMGLCAGVAGDEWNLGFVAETERQVFQHLNYHLTMLPTIDKKSATILTQMSIDEDKHATTAINSGAKSLPAPIKLMMRATSKIMTTLAYWI